jgi:hypothetical protein
MKRPWMNHERLLAELAGLYNQYMALRFADKTHEFPRQSNEVTARMEMIPPDQKIRIC